MKGVYIFMAFQILIGVWLFISPLVLQIGEPSARISNMIFGALVVILGVGVSLYEYYTREAYEPGRFVEHKA